MYRAYNASLGRWINRDPIGELGGINLYAYVMNEPINNVDPSGLATICRLKLPPCLRGRCEYIEPPQLNGIPSPQLGPLPGHVQSNSPLSGEIGSDSSSVTYIPTVTLLPPITLSLPAGSNVSSEDDDTCESEALAAFQICKASCFKQFPGNDPNSAAARYVCISRCKAQLYRDLEDCKRGR